MKQYLFPGLVCGILLFASACRPVTPLIPDGKVRVLATTSIVADVVAQVGGDYIDLFTLMPVGTDPHEFQARPLDAAAMADADIIFANGAGLEKFLQPVLESAGAIGKLVEISDGIDLIPYPGKSQAGSDPHTWMDPNNVLVWVENITSALSRLDPAHANEYEKNAGAYAVSLRDLDSWIRTEVAQIQLENRLLVVDHAVLGYFSARYGFTQLGTVTGSFSSDAAPSARELAVLENEIRRSGVRALFVSEAVNQPLADQIAADTGIPSVWIYHASLTDAGGPAASYLEFMRYNVRAIVQALK